MSVSTSRKIRSSAFNVPNQLSCARLVLAIVLFVFLGLGYYLTSLALFLLAAGTDWLDGYWARKYGQITVLGRILDPLADKLVICGTFVFLAAVPQSEVRAWMAVVILARELLVTALRSFLEEQGKDFSAGTAGKWKMAIQCLAVALCLYRLSYLDGSAEVAEFAGEPPRELTWLLIAALWATVLITIYSGIGYIFAAIRLLRK
jgi:CDP-diacylglycerol--glycerol-3-phosphate 3-phosphatidyltransferase